MGRRCPQCPESHAQHLGPLTKNDTSPWCHFDVPFVLLVLRTLLKERYAILPIIFEMDVYAVQ
jgi:hypothetical protein